MDRVHILMNATDKQTDRQTKQTDKQTNKQTRGKVGRDTTTVTSNRHPTNDQLEIIHNGTGGMTPTRKQRVR